jgi:transcription elongation GreA/GreB family factor
MVANRLEELQLILKNAIIVTSFPLDKNRVSIGSIVKIEHDGVFTKEYRVSGYGESDFRANPQRVVYSAPIISPFIGREVGHTCKVRLDQSKRQVNLTLVGLRTK